MSLDNASLSSYSIIICAVPFGSMIDKIDLTEDVEHARGRRHNPQDQDTRLLKNPFTPSYSGISSYNYKELSLQPGSDIILTLNRCMRVHKIKRDAFGNVLIKGWLFEPTERYAGCFAVSDTELCMTVDVIKTARNNDMAPKLVILPIHMVIDLCEIIITNLPSVRSTEPRVFVCRWKVVNYYNDTEALKKSKPTEVAGRRFAPIECDEAYAAENYHLLLDWRDCLDKGGSAEVYLPGESEYLRAEQIAAKTQSLGVTSDDVRSAQAHVLQPKLVSNIIADLDTANAFGTSDSPSCGMTDKSPRLTDLDSTEDDEYEELMLPPIVEDGPKEGQGAVSSRLGAYVISDDEESDSSGGTLIAADTRHPCFPVVSQHSSLGSRTYKGSATSTRKLISTPAFPERNGAASAYTMKKSSSTGATTSKPSTSLCKRKAEDFDSPGPSPLRPSNVDEHREKRRSILPVSRKRRRYTLGDGFCGAGGVSRGGVMANLRPRWAFDFNKDACVTYAKNFFKVGIHHNTAHNFLQLDTSFLKIDILHLSPPCQYFSPAHTHDGPDDEMNVASLYAVSRALQRCKPRVVTLEETSGLQDQTRHKQFFQSLIGQLTDNGYSFRWRIIRCCDWGVPQQRRRLFLIAAW